MNPILKDFPNSLDTPRLTIRAPRPGDGPALNAAVRESWAELHTWMPWAAADEPPEVAVNEEYVRRQAAAFLAREDLPLLIFLRDSDTCLGGTGLHRINWRVPRFEIGYWLRTSYTGQGYATEVALGVSQFAFDVLGARRVEIRCDALNQRSAAVARRAGFVHEVTLRCDDRHHLTNQLRDTMIFAKVRPESEAALDLV
jgi:RimJ/RimL family protein N-acetyltransferase